MENKIWNINLLLCQNTNQDITKIDNVFNKLVVNKDKPYGKFEIITILNSIRSTESKIALYYFMELLDEKHPKVMYLCKSMIKRKTHNDSEMKTSMPGITQKNIRLEINKCLFPQAGNYEIKVYKYDDDEIIDDDELGTKEMVEMIDEEHLITVYPFLVKYTNV